MTAPSSFFTSITLYPDDPQYKSIISSPRHSAGPSCSGNTDHSRVCAVQSRSWQPEVLLRNDVRATSVTSVTSACLPHSFIVNALRRSSVRDWPGPYPGEVSRFIAQDQVARGARSESGGLICSRIVLEFSAGTNIMQSIWCFWYAGRWGFTDNRDSTTCCQFTDCHDFGVVANSLLPSVMSFMKSFLTQYGDIL